MAAKEIKRLTGNLALTNAIALAIQIAHEAGLSADDVKATLERFATLLEEE
jgi:UDP-N-acetylmuramyl pentapeptide synthase